MFNFFLRHFSLSPLLLRLQRFTFLLLKMCQFWCRKNQFYILIGNEKKGRGEEGTRGKRRQIPLSSNN